MGLNPNVASVILDGSGLATDEKEMAPESLAEEIAESGKRVEILEPGGEDTIDLISKGVRLAREMVYDASKLRRKPCSDDCLMFGVKCGSSDTISGLAGNPAIGYVYDKLVKAGGTAFFGENTEIIGAEHVLAKRAVNRTVAEEILRVARETEERAKSTGQDIRTMNPIPANIRAGISTLEEKSLGAIHKAGSMPIQGVLKYAERPRKRGLYFVDNWAARTSIFVGYVAAGAQVVLFQLGGGGYRGDGPLYQTCSTIAPLVWCSANPKTRGIAGFNLDFYSGTIIEGKETVEEAGERLYKTILDISSGTMTRTEALTYVDPVELYTKGPVF